MMDRECLNYLATDKQKKDFERDGYIIIKNVLSPGLIDTLIDASERVDALERRFIGGCQDSWTNNFNVISHDDAFLNMVDYYKTLPKVWALLKSAQIQLYMSHLIVYPPEGDGVTPGHEWHQDGCAVRDTMGFPQPALSLKVSYWLTDVKTPEYGPFRVLPGSHLMGDDFSDTEADKHIKDLYVDAGDCVIFDRRLYHRRGVNTSDTVRRTLFMGYSYRWLRPLDYINYEDILDKCSPVRQQLLGKAFWFNSYWEPEELPLEHWIRENITDGNSTDTTDQSQATA